MERPFKQRLPFDQAVKEIVSIVTAATQSHWDSLSQLNGFQDAVFLKNASGIIIYHNEAASTNFYPSDSLAVGRQGPDVLMDKSFIAVAKASDSLILSGVKCLEMEHVGCCSDGLFYRLRTHKRSMADLEYPGLSLLGLTRVEEVLPATERHPRIELGYSYQTFLSMEERDREIAKLLSQGVTTREIAERMKLTVRAIELRRQKILATLGVDHLADLVKLLVRLHDRGFLDFGL